MKRHTFIWTSFSDLMTSLFFIMLVLFVLTVVMLEKNHEQTAILHKRTDSLYERTDSLYRTTKARLDRINEIEEGIRRIDPQYFAYNERYKKHILKIDVRFPVGESNIYLLTTETQKKLLDAGRTISSFMQAEHEKNPNVKYLLIVEGQASGGYYYHYHTDDYRNNDVLSYQRALGLWNFWKQWGIRFGEECEPLICGSGEGGVPRSADEEQNQRFLVHIVLKAGALDSLTDENQHRPSLEKSPTPFLNSNYPSEMMKSGRNKQTKTNH